MSAHTDHSISAADLARWQAAQPRLPRGPVPAPPCPRATRERILLREGLQAPEGTHYWPRPRAADVRWAQADARRCAQPQTDGQCTVAIRPPRASK